ncbi:penicillin-insensitive murein endopeptidase [Pseudahrensia aquimaris]|uniref:Penicillin-insensitive murein endopeptidase n=1 Tax=Pseudahrensia aquimaris TaxID=744461 RepID=A0ABW3FK82_9HYPH
MMLKPLTTALAALFLVQAPDAFAAKAAKRLFGKEVSTAAALKPAVYGTYNRGCLAGGEKLADDGPTWQAMRPNRNRHWAHPELISLVKQLSRDGKKVGWNGLLVGDLTQPRGGPMWTGHASHQAGLDADIWLTPMPNRRLSRKERNETFQPISMRARGANGKLTHQKLNPKAFTDAHAGIIRTAAQYRNVERIFVHPTIKREMCRRYPSQPKWLAKVRAQYGHHYHMHIRIGCPAGSTGCKSQRPVPSMGCDQATMDYWFKVAYGPPRKPKPGEKPVVRKPKPPITLAQLPQQCRTVLTAPGIDGSPSKVAFASSGAGASPAAKAAASLGDLNRIATPTPRPAN